MGNHAIQFHAAPDEVFSLAIWIASEFPTRVFGTQFPPQARFEIASTELSKRLANPNLINVAFVLDGKRSRPVTATTMPEDALVLQIARLKNDQLRQSAIGICTTSSRAMKVWNAVARRVRKMTRGGATATNPTSGASATYRNFRFSKGAEALAQKGVVMRLVAGGTVITFPSYLRA